MSQGLKRTCNRTLKISRQSPLFSRLTVNQTEKIAPIVNSSDGIVRARELHDALSGIAWKINCLESIFCNLVVGTRIDQEQMNLPDFLIFLCQRREHLSIRTLYEDVTQKHFTEYVTATELQSWLKEHGKAVSLGQAQKIIEKMDLDADGVANYEDLLTVVTARLLTLNIQS